MPTCGVFVGGLSLMICEDWNGEVEMWMHKIMQLMLLLSTHCRQIKKFKKLQTKAWLWISYIPVFASPQPPGSSISSGPNHNKPHLRSQGEFMRQTLVSFGQLTLFPTETTVFFLIKNFALVPRSSPFQETIQSTKAALHHLPKTTANDVHLKISL